jgi:hypothetical protein
MRIHGSRADETTQTHQIETAIRILLRAHDLAQDVRCDVLEFAVDLQEFYVARVSLSTLRWLVLKGHAQHVVEMTGRHAKRRSFRTAGNLSLSTQSCFVLSKSGLRRAHTILAKTENEATHLDPKKPRWDAGRRTLFLGDRVVKRFKGAVGNQELVVIAFDGQAWPRRIDDPLPFTSVQNPKRRLHDGIKNLNHAQIEPLIHFFGDGSSRGVGWELRRLEDRGFPKPPH